MQGLWFIEDKVTGSHKPVSYPPTSDKPHQYKKRVSVRTKVTGERHSKMRGSKRDWLFRVQVIIA